MTVSDLRVPSSSRHQCSSSPPPNGPSSAIDLTDLTRTPPMMNGALASTSPYVSPAISRTGSPAPTGFDPDPDFIHPNGTEIGDMAILLKTVDFAARKHSFQRRKDVDQSPYINHPIAVANYLASTGITDVRVLQAAVLHDTVEDTDTTVQELREIFGDDVAAIVDDCTDNTELSGQQRKEEQIRSAKHKSREAQQVKLADKLHNLESIRRSPPVGWSTKRVQAYFMWAKQVTDACAASHPPLAEVLDVLYKTAYTRVEGKYQPCHPEVAGKLSEEEKARIDQRFRKLKEGEEPPKKPIFF